jgi:hypothetical protein
MITTAVDRKNRWVVLKMVCKDIMLALTGLLVSIILATSINPSLRAEVIGFFKGG